LCTCTLCTDYKDDLKDLLVEAQDNITSMKTLADPYIEAGRTLIDRARCGFLGRFYRTTEHIVCTNLMYGRCPSDFEQALNID